MADKHSQQLSTASSNRLSTPKNSAPAIPHSTRTRPPAAASTAATTTKRLEGAVAAASAITHPVTGEFPPHLSSSLPAMESSRGNNNPGDILSPTPARLATQNSASATNAPEATPAAAPGNQGDGGDADGEEEDEHTFSPATLDEQRTHIRDRYLSEVLELDIDMQAIPGTKPQTLSMTTREHMASVRLLKPCAEFFPRIGTLYHFAVGLIGHIEALTSRLEDYLGWTYAALGTPDQERLAVNWHEVLTGYLNDDYVRYGEILRTLRYTITYC
ncbi:hypothetical protein EXIGLDRAFT_699652, partial [Exidia glandulosa HHB12029]